MRKLRMSENNSKEIVNTNSDNIIDRKLKIVDNSIKEKADRLLSLKTLLAHKEKEAKKIKEEIDEIQSTILEYGREHELDTLTSDTAQVLFLSRLKRNIDPKTFLMFLKEHGKTKDFYQYVDVPITNVIKNFGEAVLESSGVLTCTNHTYTGLKISSRK